MLTDEDFAIIETKGVYEEKCFEKESVRRLYLGLLSEERNL